MQWREMGVVMGTRPYGDEHLLLSILTRNRGLRRGLTRLTKKRPLQIGDLIDATWRAKLPTNLGHFTCEVIASAFYSYFRDRIKLMCLSSITHIMSTALPENEPHPTLYDSFQDFAAAAEAEAPWYNHYLKLELLVLSQLGFALDLSKCAVSNSKDNLLFISPKTGRALSEAVGHAYRNKLLPLPKVLRSISCGVETECCSADEFALSLKILGFFLHRHLLQESHTFQESRKILTGLLG
ncbi:DNA repair protein RecO [Anaplasma marginale str. Dawn]|uniref:DNA repair protein RecO n=1 Tax=Anaplasma marginale (strain Florida) TaxID=320483 RepID=RECO_ANAMF|nr:DNA repair protein RecO [Anaplasma marginale]B9KIQ1.1 RecName: Full=DNA repair protein RecO; AltName: Full=Recombination protein O [Anaplasma marginale str. Florida]ACM49363.1 DNA repair protein RecO [Anaplasma marginale str. Florida]AGZ78893.1 DNA repair protein RecO [Anaplasma marginale str. Gypsy Plains]AGZ79720.1 DNA repair protein RecO [Anaplasma marginale str. Dawn]AXW84095.1 DNA repair protein RecO [Anaplasma marginale]